MAYPCSLRLPHAAPVERSLLGVYGALKCSVKPGALEMAGAALRYGLNALPHGSAGTRARFAPAGFERRRGRPMGWPASSRGSLFLPGWLR